MSETKTITSLYVITDTENGYDQIGDIEGGGFDEQWLEDHIMKYGVEGLLKILSQMNYQIQDAYIDVQRQNNITNTNIGTNN